MAIAPRTIQSSPNIPAMQGADPKLIDYLHSFALWCRHGFADKLSGTMAQPGIMLLATDASTGATTTFVYQIGVKVTVTGGVPSAPTITFTALPLGEGKP